MPNRWFVWLLTVAGIAAACGGSLPDGAAVPSVIAPTAGSSNGQCSGRLAKYSVRPMTAGELTEMIRASSIAFRAPDRMGLAESFGGMVQGGGIFFGYGRRSLESEGVSFTVSSAVDATCSNLEFDATPVTAPDGIVRYRYRYTGSPASLWIAVVALADVVVEIQIRWTPRRAPDLAGQLATLNRWIDAVLTANPDSRQ